MEVELGVVIGKEAKYVLEEDALDYVAGDIISTGTPPGVGLGFNLPKYLKEGDTMRHSISGLDEQQQTVERYKA